MTRPLIKGMDDLTPSYVHLGYFHIPTKPNYVIDVHGNVINQMSGRKLSMSKSASGRKDRGHYFQCAAGFRHRLLALTFIDCSEEIKHLSFEELQVNHKNGIKGDDELTNLEWCTRSKNALHAIEEGLMDYSSKRKPLVVTDNLSGTRTEFVSMKEASSYVGIKTNLLTDKLRGANKTTHRHFTVERQEVCGIEGENVSGFNSILSKSLLSGEVTVYDNAGIAAKRFGVPSKRVRSYLYGTSSTPIEGHVFKYVSEEEPWPYVEDVLIEVIKRNPSAPPLNVYVVTDTVGGGRELYINSRQVANEYSIAESSVFSHTNKSKLLKDRYLITVHTFKNSRYSRNN